MATDQTTTLATLKAQLKEFCEARDWDQFHDPKELAIGLITEASELLEIFRFQSPEQMRTLLANPNSKQKISDELADALFFVVRFAQRNEIDLASAFEAKMKRNNEKYPVEKSKGSNRKYNDL